MSKLLNSEVQPLITGPDTAGQEKVTSDTNSRQEKSHQTLKEQSPPLWKRVGVPGTLLVFPFAYAALLGLVGFLDNEKESAFGNNVMEALQVASTLWPISFAAVLGPCLKTLALYGAEKGSTLLALEFLSASQTTFSAFLNLVTFGRRYPWAVPIAVLWCLSPLGGQAAVRSLSLVPNSATIQTPAIYQFGSNISGMNAFYLVGGTRGVFNGGIMQEEHVFDFRNIVAAAFSTPDVLASNANGSSEAFNQTIQTLGGRWQASRISQRDLWRNVRIPFLELLPGYDATRPDDWVPVPTDTVVSYASFIGTPIRGASFDRAGNSTLVIRSHYQTVSCGADFNGSSWVQPGTGHFYSDRNLSSTWLLYHYRYETYKMFTYSNIFLDALNDDEMKKEHLFWGPQYSRVDIEPSVKMKLILGGKCTRHMTQSDYLRICDLSTSYVDVEVSCTRATASDDLNCRASRLRHTSGFPLSGNLTALSNTAVLNGLIWEFPFVTADYDIARPGLIDAYLKNPPETLSRRNYSSAGCFSDVPLGAFEARFATALNTVIMATFNATVVTGADGTSLENRSPPMWRNTTATWSEFTESVYTLHKSWYIIWALSTAILFVSVAANIVIRAIITAPDFLNNIAGLTRDSPFVDVPQERSGESGSDRLERLKQTQVRISDVKSDAEVGRIALTTDMGGRKLAWGRRYE